MDEVRNELFECMYNISNYNECLIADIQLDLFNQARGEFGSHLVIDSRKLRSPTSW